MAAADELTYVSDLDFWQRTPRERIVVANAHFDLDHDLNNVPLNVGEWIGKDAPETNQEVMILLEPEQYVQRLYQDPAGHYIWLTMVGGRNSQPFHAPDICYDADGWQYNLGSHATPLPDGGEIYGLYLDATKNVAGEAAPWQHVVYYFYLFPDDSARPERRHRAVQADRSASTAASKRRWRCWRTSPATSSAWRRHLTRRLRPTCSVDCILAAPSHEN